MCDDDEVIKRMKYPGLAQEAHDICNEITRRSQAISSEDGLWLLIYDFAEKIADAKADEPA